MSRYIARVKRNAISKLPRSLTQWMIKRKTQVEAETRWAKLPLVEVREGFPKTAHEPGTPAASLWLPPLHIEPHACHIQGREGHIQSQLYENHRKKKLSTQKLDRYYENEEGIRRRRKHGKSRNGGNGAQDGEEASHRWNEPSGSLGQGFRSRGNNEFRRNLVFRRCGWGLLASEPYRNPKPRG